MLTCSLSGIGSKYEINKYVYIYTTKSDFFHDTNKTKFSKLIFKILFINKN